MNVVECYSMSQHSKLYSNNNNNKTHFSLVQTHSPRSNQNETFQMNSRFFLLVWSTFIQNEEVKELGRMKKKVKEQTRVRG